MRLFDERIHNRLFEINTAAGKSALPIQNVDIQGIEYQFKWQPLETTRLLFNQTFSRISSEYLASAIAMPNTTLSSLDKRQDVKNFTEYSMPGRSTSMLLMQKLPFGLDFSLAGYWQGKMKWTTNTWSPSYHRYDARLGYPFRFGAVGGELALTVQSLNGAHNEYAVTIPTQTPDTDRIVERRQWVSLRLDY
jgi:iron complex outermembrane receptor protein